MARTAFAADKPAIPPEFAAITDDPKLPRVLLMGDSVSIAYALEVRKLLAGVANVHRVPANCGSTKTALGSYGLVRWFQTLQRNGMSFTSIMACMTSHIVSRMIATRTTRANTPRQPMAGIKTCHPRSMRRICATSSLG